MSLVARRLSFLAALLAATFPFVGCSSSTAETPSDATDKDKQASIHNLEAIGTAMSKYVETVRRYPAATGTVTNRVKNQEKTLPVGDQPLLSWRVHLLKYLTDPAAQKLAEEFKMDEPWDSDHNKKLIERMPDVYKSPGSKGAAEFKTVYLTPRSDKTLFPANRSLGFLEVTDGTIRTITVLEVSDERAVIWTKPDDYEVDEKNPAAGLVGLRPGEFLALFGSGMVRQIPANISPELLNSTYTRSGGEKIDSKMFMDDPAVVAKSTKQSSTASKATPPQPPANQNTATDDVNLREIGKALITYAAQRHNLPAATRGGSKAGPDGPALSWRVRLLPYLGEGELYSQFKLDEPWDSEHNKKLIERMPTVYKAPRSRAARQFKTVYLTPRGEKTAFPGDREINPSELSDGNLHTILVVQASDTKAVIWTKPDDYEYNEKSPQAGLVGLQRKGFLAAFFDGNLRFIPQDTPASEVVAYFTRNGGERINNPLPPIPAAVR
jgi:hypothetical protein